MQYVALIDKRHDSDYGFRSRTSPARSPPEMTQADVARTYNVDATTIGRLQPSPFEGVSAAA